MVLQLDCSWRVRKMNPVVLGLNCTKRGLVCADLCRECPRELLRSKLASQADFLQTATSRNLHTNHTMRFSTSGPARHTPTTCSPESI